MTVEQAKKTLQLDFSCTDLQKITKQFRKLALIHHPDKGGKQEKFVKIREAYEILLNEYNIIRKSSQNQKDDFVKDEILTKKILETLNTIRDESVTFEIIGFWIWASGETYENKENLKKLGFKFSRKKVAWYWQHPVFTGKKTKKSFTINDLKKMHGSQQLAQKILKIA